MIKMPQAKIEPKTRLIKEPGLFFVYAVSTAVGRPQEAVELLKILKTIFWPLISIIFSAKGF